jgi:hypothetical protein
VTLLLPLLAFVFGTLIITAGAMAMMPRRATAIERRLEELTAGGPAPREEAGPRFQSLIGLLKRVGEKAPRSPKELGALRLRLVQAGYRRDEALTIFFGIRVTLALVLFSLLSTSFVTRPNLTFALGGLGLGYVLPGMALARRAKARAHRIRLALADMLDLLVVSVEAGLGLDQSGRAAEAMADPAAAPRHRRSTRAARGSARGDRNADRPPDRARRRRRCTVSASALAPDLSQAAAKQPTPPPPPATIAETGLHRDTLSQLMLKTLVAGEASGTGLAERSACPTRCSTR